MLILHRPPCTIRIDYTMARGHDGVGESDIDYYHRNNNIEYQNIIATVRCVEKFDNAEIQS